MNLLTIKRPRILRLLPGVALISAALLILNGSGLFHDAAALAQTALNTDPVPANPDYAGSDDQIASAAQADMLTVMSRRRGELDTREAQIKMQADILAATEQRVDAKIAQLQALQTKISSLLGDRDDAQKVQIAALVKTYSGMKPAAAARIFDTLPDEVLVPVAQMMKPDILGAVLSAMNPDSAQKLTVKLADRLTLPVTTDTAPVQTASVASNLGAPSTAPAATAPSSTPAQKPKP
jgi:flagellar motility protein MotE (MotC chaperone)